MQRASFIRGDPSIKMLQKIDVSLEVLAGGGGLDRFLVLEVIEVVPELKGEVLEDCPDAELPLAEGKGQNDDILFQLR